MCDPGQITNYLSLCYLLGRANFFLFWLQFCKMHETLKQKIQLLIGDKAAYKKGGVPHLK